MSAKLVPLTPPTGGTHADRVALVRQVGEAIYGQRWQQPLARDLGPLHPTKSSLSDRMVRMWLSSGKDLKAIPSWVSNALARLLRQTAEARRRDASMLDALASSIEKTGSRLW